MENTQNKTQRGRWYVEVQRAGAHVLEEDAGAGGGPGLVAVCERIEDAAWMVAAWNRRQDGAR